MSDEENLQVSISGKAIYKAVKNLLQNDEEFKQKVSDKVGELLHDVDVVKTIVDTRIDALLQDTKLTETIDLMVRQSINRQLPDLFKAKVDRHMKQSLLDVLRKLSET
jgi:hypothetical protein